MQLRARGCCTEKKNIKVDTKFIQLGILKLCKTCGWRRTFLHRERTAQGGIHSSNSIPCFEVTQNPYKLSYPTLPSQRLIHNSISQVLVRDFTLKLIIKKKTNPIATNDH